MPDISMCTSRECPRKETCYRYVAEPNQFWQSYSDFDHEDCEYYCPTEEDDE